MQDLCRQLGRDAFGAFELRKFDRPGHWATGRAASSTRPKTVILGVIALDDDAVETPAAVAARIAPAQPYAGEIIAAPGCGMKYLSRGSAFGKLQALVAGARLASATASRP